MPESPTKTEEQQVNNEEKKEGEEKKEQTVKINYDTFDPLAMLELDEEENFDPKLFQLKLTAIQDKWR